MFKDITNLSQVAQHRKNLSFINYAQKQVPTQNRLRTGSSLHQISVSQGKIIKTQVSEFKENKQELFAYGEEILLYSLLKFDYIEYRECLIKQVYEMKDRFSFSNTTIYLCIQLFDKLILSRKVSKSEMKAFLICCLTTSMKLEENYPPLVVHICDQANVQHQIVFNLEFVLLSFFSYQVQQFTIIFFLNILGQFSSFVKQTQHYFEFLISKFIQRAIIISIYPQFAIFAIINIGSSHINYQKEIFSQQCIKNFISKHSQEIEKVQIELNAIHKSLMRSKEFSMECLKERDVVTKLKIKY